MSMSIFIFPSLFQLLNPLTKLSWYSPRTQTACWLPAKLSSEYAQWLYPEASVQRELGWGAFLDALSRSWAWTSLANATFI